MDRHRDRRRFRRSLLVLQTAAMHSATRAVYLASVLALFAACGGAQTPAVQHSSGQGDKSANFEQYDARTFYETTVFFGGSFSSDEKRILVTSDATGIFNVYAQPISGGAPTPLTKSTKESIFGVGYFPADDRILYSSDQSGNELNHIYVRDRDGTSRDLTPGDKVKARFSGWSGDKKSFWLLTNERDANAFDLYRYATDGYARELVYQNKEAHFVSDVSPDGHYIALNKVRNNADSDIYLVDTQSPEATPRHITPHQGNVEHGVMSFSRDNKKLYYSTDGHGEFQQIWSYHLETGKHQPEVVADWDVMYVAFSETGRYRVSAINADARTVLEVMDTETGEKLAIPDLPGGDIKRVSFSRSETKMAFYLASDRSPSDLHILDLATGEHRKLTNALNPAIDPAHLVDGQVVRYASFDGREIPAILYRPITASSQNRVPALVWVHGGPGGQSRLGYRALIQHLVNHGYAILAVNNRGSFGYGKTFYHLDDKNHGEGDLKDCVWARKYLESLDWVDGARVGIIGGSYGGFMVLAALAFEPDAFNLGIDIFGVSNWLRTLESIPPWWAAFREALYAEMGDPKTDRQRLERISPLFHAKNIKKPLLVIQGANDPRVLRVESDEIVAAVKKNGVPVEYIVFDDEGHGFLKKENRITASEAFLSFLNKHMGQAK
ncbi:MAG: S9 family peptidase [Proteobacteria bacterium]|nr:S9 family peptidase [Pseudomonadota bacterium]